MLDTNMPADVYYISSITLVPLACGPSHYYNYSSWKFIQWCFDTFCL